MYHSISFIYSDGEYTLQRCTINESDQKDVTFSTFACIHGLKDYQIPYVLQAAEMERNIGIILSKGSLKCCAHILHKKNQNCTDSKLYIAFDRHNASIFRSHFLSSLGIKVHVSFQLKDSYFKNLKKAIENLPPDVILRIQPSLSTIMPSECAFDDTPFDIENYGEFDVEQRAALKLILSNIPDGSPPILISGPFGTGKTRILAIAAHMLFQNSARILVCTQQQESAKNFLETYNGLPVQSIKVKRVLLTYRNPPLYNQLKLFYLAPDKLTNSITTDDEDNLLIITTCLTAHHLTKVEVNFTHIFIDEGAQMREPEAIAALRMAKASTKVVIAGDPKQVYIIRGRLYIIYKCATVSYTVSHNINLKCTI